MDTVSEMIQTIIYTIYVNVKVIILLAIGKLHILTKSIGHLLKFTSKT